ncbi:hypothetical protein [Planctomicrobium sp. SH664]|uniref:hypothetical protein n=1 Tax=Planctomicrobium sp. SH664 TaxID=3448125 RepID=UPI003F5C3B6C
MQGRISFLTRLLWGIFAGVFLLHLAIVLGTAVNVPIGDEWEAFNPHALSVEFPAGWILQPHNEHQIIPTKLLIWLQYRLNRWNINTSIGLNFLMFGGLLMVLFRLARWQDPTLPEPVLLCCLILQLSGKNSENHTWGFQSQFHLVLIQFLLAVRILFTDAVSWRTLGLSAVLLFSMCFTFSCGVPFAITLAGCFTLYQVSRIVRGSPENGEPLKRRGRAAGETMLIVGTAVVASLIWGANYQQPHNHPAAALPHQWEFWRFWASLVSLGFGYQRINGALDLALLVLTLAPLIIRGLQARRGRPWDVRDWSVMASILGILAALASVSAGRAPFGIAYSKASRYTEIASLLLPLVAVAWSRALQSHSRWRTLPLAAVVGLAALGFLNDWRLVRTYKSIADQRRQGVECIRQQVQTGGPIVCKEVYPGDLTERVHRAVELKVSPAGLWTPAADATDMRPQPEAELR